MGSVRALGLLLIGLALGGVWPALSAWAQVPPVGASAQVRDATGRLIAVASLRETADQVLVSFTFPDRLALTGAHGIQIHESGRCDPPDFSSAGGIFNPFGKQHGLRNPDGPMAGDMLSLTIGPTGLVGYNTSAPLAKLSPGPASLLRPGGTSMVIFAQADDNQTQPEGGAGARIACGVIIPGDVGANGAVPAAVAGDPQAARNGDPDLPTALLIGILGALLIAAGVALRRAPLAH